MSVGKSLAWDIEIAARVDAPAGPRELERLHVAITSDPRALDPSCSIDKREHVLSASFGVRADSTRQASTFGLAVFNDALAATGLGLRGADDPGETGVREPPDRTGITRLRVELESEHEREPITAWDSARDR